MADLTLPWFQPWIKGAKLPADVTRDVCRPLDSRPTALWWTAFLISFSLLAVGTAAVSYQIATGIGTWGLNKTVGWAFDITNFVFWIGIGHAGTLISAILFLLRQRWRTSVNRSAEAMTLFAVICAGIFPIIHMGRPWLAFWMFPYPNFRGPLWINFRSPLVWDFFAISTYFTISLVFWYVGLIPDLATIRDRLKPGIRQKLASLFSLGWNGSYRTWLHYETVYLLLAGLATPLVVSVHTIVSWDFATSVIPGWHTTIFPPYFVVGAIFSGMAMVLTLVILARKTMGLEEYISLRHIEVMCKIVIFTSGIVGMAYLTEFFTALYSGNSFEEFAFLNRALGPLGWCYWIMISCNVLIPQLFWFRAIRSRLALVFLISILINVGMWFERFVIIVTSLHRDYLPSSWSSYAPTSIEVATLAGSFGLFFTCFLLFCRFLPVIAMGEVKGILREPRPEVRGQKSEVSSQWAEVSALKEKGKDKEVVSPIRNPQSAIRNWKIRNPQSAITSRRLLLGTFEHESDVLQVTRAARRRGLTVVDVFAPYAVHGLDRAMGLQPSRLPWVCFALGLAGPAFKVWFEFWTTAVDWHLNVGGKPWDSLLAFVPVTFEVMVLFAGVSTVIAFFITRRLAPGKKAVMPDFRVSDDQFVLLLEETDASFDVSEVSELLRSHNAVVVEELEEGNLR